MSNKNEGALREGDTDIPVITLVSGLKFGLTAPFHFGRCMPDDCFGMFSMLRGHVLLMGRFGDVIAKVENASGIDREIGSPACFRTAYIDGDNGVCVLPGQLQRRVAKKLNLWHADRAELRAAAIDVLDQITALARKGPEWRDLLTKMDRSVVLTWA